MNLTGDVVSAINTTFALWTMNSKRAADVPKVGLRAVGGIYPIVAR